MSFLPASKGFTLILDFRVPNGTFDIIESKNFFLNPIFFVTGSNSGKTNSYLPFFDTNKLLFYKLKLILLKFYLTFIISASEVQSLNNQFEKKTKLFVKTCFALLLQ